MRTQSEYHLHMRASVVALVSVMLATRAASADEKPWVAGTTPEQRAQAQELLQKGNAKLIERDYVAALEIYRSALAVWDHPAIRFNIVRCLIQLDRPVEAVDELEHTLKYGAAPLEDSVYTEALSYQKLLANQTGTLEVSCKQQGVALTIDGQPLATCPTTVQRRVTPGRHQIVGEAAGLLPRTQVAIVVGGSTEQVAITLEPLSASARIVHRYPGWIPWVVVGSGALLAGIGGIVQLAANNDDDYYRSEVRRTCADGCSGRTLDNLRELESRARTEGYVAIGFASVGAATLIAGGVLLYLNRGRTVYETPRVSTTPLPGGGVVTFGGSF
jgi:hypothetical protein